MSLGGLWKYLGGELGELSELSELGELSVSWTMKIML